MHKNHVLTQMFSPFPLFFLVSTNGSLPCQLLENSTFLYVNQWCHYIINLKKYIQFFVIFLNNIMLSNRCTNT